MDSHRKLGLVSLCFSGLFTMRCLLFMIWRLKSDTVGLKNDRNLSTIQQIETVDQVPMPFTISHIAAVLPAKVLCPKLLSFPGLVVGSIAPDLAYIFNVFALAELSHSPLGALTFCVPAGGLLLLLMYLLAPGYERLLRVPTGTLRSSGGLISNLRRRGFIYVASLILGALSHDLWDSFTHKGGYFIHRFPEIFTAQSTIGHLTLPVYKILQYGSGLIGIAIVLLYGIGWYRSARHEHSFARGLIIRAIGLIALCGILAAVVTRLSLPSATTEQFAFALALNSMRIGFVATMVLATYLSRKEKENAQQN